MRIARATLVAVSTLAVFATATAVRAQDKLKPTERAVTISGCVVAGDHSDTYFLNDVRPVSGWNPSPDHPMYYWLNTTKGLKERLGQRVEVSGIVDFSDSHDGQKKVTIDPSETKDTKIKVSGDGKQVTVKQDTAIPKMEDAKESKTKVPAEIFDLHVKSVKTVPGACQAGK
jgi:hypothetical protein